MASAHTTRNHSTIKQWIESHGGHPAIAPETENLDPECESLCIKFDDSEVKLREIAWEEFFEAFDGKDLIFLYQNDEPGSRESQFFRFIRN